MKYFSMFSAIGGFELGILYSQSKIARLQVEKDSTSNNINSLERTPHCVGFSEIDKYAIRIYSKHFPDHKNFGDATKIKTEDLPDFDMLCGGFPCCKNGTLITTKDGLKKIEDIKDGEFVLTHKNRFKPVLKTMNRNSKSFYFLKIQGSPDNNLTKEHPYYVRKMHKIWNNNDRCYKRIWDDPKWIQLKDLDTKCFIGFAVNQESSNVENLTEEECWLIGRYIADGYIRNNKRSDQKNSYNHQVIFCIGKHKLNEFQSKVNNYYIGISEERTAYKCRIINERFMNLCLKCGKGAVNKCIPGFIMDLPKRFLEFFLDGYMSGDGYNKNHKYKASSVSRKLIYQLGQVITKIYNTPYSITKYIPEKTGIIEGRMVNQKTIWIIQFSKIILKQNNAVFLDGYLWSPVREKKLINKTIQVYNLEVEDDNSYVANNCIVHNCQSFSIAGKRGGIEYDTRGTLFREIIRIAEAKRPRIIFLENVKGLLSSQKGWDFYVILDSLVQLGYDIEWEVLNSKNFGVPQNRERVFIIGHFGKGSGSEIFPLGRNNKGYEKIQSKQNKKKTRASCLGTRYGQRWSDESYIMHNIYGGFGEKEPRKFKDYSPTIRTPKGGGHLPVVVNKLSDYQGDVVHHDTEASQGGNKLKGIGYQDDIGRIRKLTPIECEKLQGFPDHFTAKGIDQNGKEVEISDSQRYKVLGNAVTVSVIKAIMEKMKNIL